MFQFPGFASSTYVFSTRYLLRGGFPHSEILGSKPVCRLPEAYRRLLRLSSPVAAKASTICAYSLDHITPKRRPADCKAINETYIKDYMGSLCQCNIPRLSVLRTHSINQDQPKNSGCPGAFTYITAQIVKERSVSLRRQKTADGYHPLVSDIGDGGASRDRTGDP